MAYSALQHVAAVIITRDAEATLAATLDSLVRFPEVVIYDNGSRDGTVALAQRYRNVTVHTGEFLGFGPTRNRAAALATRDWIFAVDADERADTALVDAIDALRLDDLQQVCAVFRRNYCLGKYIRFGDWGNDRLVRLYHRTQHAYTNAAVHEKLQRSEHTRVVRLTGALHHAAVTDLRQLLEKINTYSEIRKDTSDRYYSPPVVFLKMHWAFFRSYVLRLGALDGWRGLVIAVSIATDVFFKYMKIYARRQGL